MNVDPSISTRLPKLLIQGVSACIMLMIGVAACQETSERNARSSDTVDFQRDVMPIFEAHCYACHGPDRQESNYRLDVKSQALGEGDFGDPPIVAGRGQASPLIQYVAGSDGSLMMPPKDAARRLRKSEIDILRRWIDEGATWPDSLAGESQLAMSTDHWSFQRPKDIPVPKLPPSQTSLGSVGNEIDHFVIEKLTGAGLKLAERADRVTLIRRVYLVLHGLHPSQATIENFLEDDSVDAYANMVDSALASHHYGERWARHWLDVVRFGESTGYEVNRDRANAFHFRDYVIDAFNDDKSYKDFILEQLAGDAVGEDAATGFLVGGPNDIVKSPDVNLTLMQREDELADYVNTTSTSFLALTVGCARCHNHKFDPILQRDYYSLQAVFAGVEHGERKLNNQAPKQVHDSLAQIRSRLESQLAQLEELRVHVSDEQRSDPRLPMVNSKQNSDTFDSEPAKFVRFTVITTNQSEPCIDEIEIYDSHTRRNVALASHGTLVTSSGNFANNPKHKLAHINDGKYGNDFSWISDSVGTGWIEFEIPNTVEIDRVVWGRDREGVFQDRLPTDYNITVSSDGKVWQEVFNSSCRRPLTNGGKEPEDAFIGRLPKAHVEFARQLYDEIQMARSKIRDLEATIPVGYVGTFRQPGSIHRLYRGDPLAPREEVRPDTLEIMGSLDLQTDSLEQSRRLALARWIASDTNPLTARVIVNRVWHYYFGQGIVATPSDFGKNGARPTHPELLDWLATRFMQNGWSLKWLHRQILLSDTFQQSSRPVLEAVPIDADCKLLWRFPPRRLEAEAIRDCVLQLSGKLNLQVGGPGFLLFKIDRENVHHYFPLDKFEEKHFRRMIYMTKIRQEKDDVFGVFDCPDGGQAIPDRTRSTTALQALNLLNSPFMIQQASFLADRLRAESPNDVGQQVNRAFEKAYSRLPSSVEMEDSISLIETHGLEAFCRAIMNTNEFLFLS